MATKTIINCLDQSNPIIAPSTTPHHQGISIIIDPANHHQQAATPFAIAAASSSTVSNVIKIQHSCQESQMLTTLNSNNNNNKLLIDINRNQQTTLNDHYERADGGLETMRPPSEAPFTAAIVKVKCTTSSGYSREMPKKANENPMMANVKLETVNGTKQPTRDHRERREDYNNDDVVDDNDVHLNDQQNNDGQEKEKSLANCEELTKNNNESGQTAKIHRNNTTTTNTTTATTSQQVNGNSKCRENNGHFSANQPHMKQNHHNDDDDGNDDDHPPHHQPVHDHLNDDHANGNDHDDNDDDDNIVKFTGIGKRDSMLDFSHGKRWPVQDNSNSLLTKADTATTQLHSPSLSSLTINANGIRKENFQQTPSEKSLANPAAVHVVKIQIKPKNTSSVSNATSSLEKQISIVKIEANLNRNLENAKETETERKNIENVNENENLRKSENCSATKHNVEAKEEEEAILKKSELHLNLDKMVQKSHHHQNAVTVTGGGGGVGSVGSTSTPANALPTGNSGATTVTELNVTNPNYLYYMMSSGQFSPCDTLDSGTGSDLETQQHSTQSSPHGHPSNMMMLTKKSSSQASNKNGLEMHLKSTKIRVSSSSSAAKGQDQRNCSFTDSEESEASSLSCDSLHSSEFMRQSSTSPIQTKTPSPSSKILGSYLPDSLLRDIKNLKFTSTEYEAENENDEEDDLKQRIKSHKQRTNETYEPISSQDYMLAQNDYVKTRNSLNTHNNNNSSSANNHSTNHNTASPNPQLLSASLKRSSMPSKTFVLNQEDGTFIDMKMNSMPRKYEADKYYNFHVNEHENFRSFGNNMDKSIGGFGDGGGSGSDTMSLSEYDTRSINDDVFAGYRDIRCGSATSTIRSSKGTVRGVKNRVRNGIATFLQLQQPNLKNFKEKDSGKVVLYTTSMGIIRDTYAKCSNVKQILRTLLVKFEERDVFMSVEYQQEIKERMHSEIIKVPQLFVEGQHIGDADTVERLNESGELRQLLKPYKSIATTFTCQTCGGYRLLPCPSCNGSKKSVHRNHFTAEFVALKCMNCDEVGLVKCHNC